MIKRTVKEAAHAIKKLGGTIRIVATLFMARTFGEHIHSGWNGCDYALYRWLGDEWFIPTAPVDKEEDK